MSDELTLDELLKAKELLRPRRRTQQEVEEHQALDKRYADFLKEYAETMETISKAHGEAAAEDTEASG